MKIIMIDAKRLLKKEHAPAALLLATWGVLFTVIFCRVLSLRPDGLYAGHENVWSDWSLHLAMARLFALKPMSQWFEYHPYFAGGKFTYPFLSNLFPALLMRAGFGIVPAFAIASVVSAWALLVGLYLLGSRLLRSGWQATGAIFLYLLSSGPGFLSFVGDLAADPSWSALFYPPRDYSRIESAQWLAGNVLVATLVPQRAFLLGQVLGVWGLLLLYIGHEKHRRACLVGAGLCLGLLPIAHAHTAIALCPLLGIVAYLHRKSLQETAFFAVPFVVLAGSLYLRFVAGGIQNSGFMRLSPGWTCGEGFLAWLWMWFRIWGFIWFVAAAGAVFFWKDRKARKLDRAVVFGLFLPFVCANLVLFQPTAWDNSKLFFWSYLSLSWLAAHAIARLWRKRAAFSKPAAALLALMLTATGLMETMRLVQFEKHTFRMTAASEIELGERVRETTAHDAVFLTAPEHNHFITLWGIRPILLGYLGWVANYGFDYGDRLADLEKMFKGEGDVDALLRKYHVRYVAVGPPELRQAHANEKYFLCHYGIALQNLNYRIYDVEQPINGCP